VIAARAAKAGTAATVERHKVAILKKDISDSP
jgi:hypothetical protein